MEQIENNTEDVHENTAEDISMMTAHTFFRIRSEISEDLPPGLSPQDMKEAYCFDRHFKGEGIVIAIVGAFNYPTALNDFKRFQQGIRAAA